MRHLLIAIVMLVAGAAHAVTIDEFPLPPGSTIPQSITLGPDGNLWFALRGSDQIGRITPTGTITTFAVPGSGSAPRGITAGPDGALWFTEYGSGEIGRMTTAGVVTHEYALPPGSQPVQIATGTDGNLYATNAAGGAIFRVVPGGVATTIPVDPFVGALYGISPPEVGSRHVIAFVSSARSSVLYLEPPSTLYESVIAVGAGAVGLTRGPDGSLWTTIANLNRIGRVSDRGTRTMTGVSRSATPWGITSGPDGRLWFTEYDGNRIGQAELNGYTIGEYAIPSPSTYPYAITPGPAGDLWFTEEAGNRIGRVRLDGDVHDTKINPLPIVRMRIRRPNTRAGATVDITVGNADVTPRPELPGHTIWLTVVNLTCPNDLISSFPDLDPMAPGTQSERVVPGGTSVTATMQLTANSRSFRTSSELAPVSCRILLTATTRAPSPNIDPTPSDNSWELQVIVVDENDIVP